MKIVHAPLIHSHRFEALRPGDVCQTPAGDVLVKCSDGHGYNLRSNLVERCDGQQLVRFCADAVLVLDGYKETSS